MDSITKLDEKIKQLQLLREEEERKLELKQNSFEHNLEIIYERYLQMKEQLDKNNYSKSNRSSMHQDRKNLPLVEAIFNSLSIMNERISRIENIFERIEKEI